MPAARASLKCMLHCLWQCIKALDKVCSRHVVHCCISTEGSAYHRGPTDEIRAGSSSSSPCRAHQLSLGLCGQTKQLPLCGPQTLLPAQDLYDYLFRRCWGPEEMVIARCHMLHAEGARQSRDLWTLLILPA